MRDKLVQVRDYLYIALRLVTAQISSTEMLAKFDARVHRVDVAPWAPLICLYSDDQTFIELALAHQAMLAMQGPRCALYGKTASSRQSACPERYVI
jgi:hypothetical protein